MIRLRQVAFAARDLPEAERRLVDALDLELCHRDPDVAVFGLDNALFPVGDQFLEIVAPTTEGTTAGRLLDKRGADTGSVAARSTTPPSTSSRPTARTPAATASPTFAWPRRWPTWLAQPWTSWGSRCASSRRRRGCLSAIR